MDKSKEFKIRFTGGLGDCLKMLTEQTSLFQFYKENGLLIHWVYSEINIVDQIYSKYNGSKIANGRWAYIRDYDKAVDYNIGTEVNIAGGYPVHQALYDFLKHFNFFHLVEQEAYANLDVPELDNWRINSYPEYSYSNQLKGRYEVEKGGWKIEVKDDYVDTLLNDCQYTFCFQLSGSNPAKNYDPDKYVKIFKMILDRYKSCKIFLIDRPNYTVDPSLLFDERIVNLVGSVTIMQCALLIQKVDYLICPDSYSKYLRKWVDGKQVILCTRLDCHPNVNSMLQDAFNYVGLLNDPNIVLLGTTYTIKDNVVDSSTIVNTMNDIDPEEIFKAITEL